MAFAFALEFDHSFVLDRIWLARTRLVGNRLRGRGRERVAFAYPVAFAVADQIAFAVTLEFGGRRFRDRIILANAPGGNFIAGADTFYFSVPHQNVLADADMLHRRIDGPAGWGGVSRGSSDVIAGAYVETAADRSFVRIT
jgi:hypothetical protein